MLQDIVDVQVLDAYTLHLVFEDGVSGDVDISSLIDFSGVFAPMKELSFFRSVKVDHETGVIFWPNEADIDSDVLYYTITGEPIPLLQDKVNP